MAGLTTLLVSLILAVFAFKVPAGATGKMILPQSIAVAAAAVGLASRESELLRFALKYSVMLLLFVCILTFLQSNVLAWMIP